MGPGRRRDGAGRSRGLLGGRPPPDALAAPEGGRALALARLGESGRLGGGEPRTPEGTAAGEKGSRAPGSALGALADPHVAWTAPGPLRARPRAGAAGGVPRGACFPQRVMFGAGPAPPVAMETKQGRWRRPERSRARACVGGWEVGSRAVALVTGTEAPLRFIRVTACQPVPPVFAVWPPFLVYSPVPSGPFPC